jgi:hypothetical protein
VLGAIVGKKRGLELTVETAKGRELGISAHAIVGRGGVGHEVVKRDKLTRVIKAPPTLPQLTEENNGAE